MQNSPSIMKQIFRKPLLAPRSRRGPRGLGQIAISPTTACTNWVTVPNSDPAYLTIALAAEAAGFTQAQLVQGDWHFMYSPAAGSIPAGSVLSGMPGSLFMKIGSATVAGIPTAALKVCAGAGGAAATTSAAASSSTPYIIAGIAGVVILGGLIYYATE
jgi:hypothetical protein